MSIFNHEHVWVRRTLQTVCACGAVKASQTHKDTNLVSEGEIQ